MMIRTRMQDDGMGSGVNKYYQALVDMGSNGIRFSISDLTPETARVMPTVFQDRAAISLYDAQWSSESKEKSPVAAEVITEVINCLLRFKTICFDFGVPDDNVRIMATEATRDAINGKEICDEIKARTGWTVDLLPKQEEGRIGALGVASSFSRVEGLVMDLGGGSAQITWMIAKHGEVETAETAVSLPYGAAALVRRIQVAEKTDDGLDNLKAEIVSNLKKAIESIKIPEKLHKDADQEGGFTMYLSGGGFRGWGYLLLSEHSIRPYPIAVINGFTANRCDFQNVKNVTQIARGDVFRISDRRVTQVPAVALLIECLGEAFPKIDKVRFCQGGVREGALYSTLPPEIRSQHPLIAATTPYRPHSYNELYELLASALPEKHPEMLDHDLLRSVVNLFTYHSVISKDGRAAAGLHSTTTGILAAAHGVSHENRAIMGLILCERWGGELHESGFLFRMQRLVGDEVAWWCKYLGRVSALICAVYPAGIVAYQKPKILLAVKNKDGLGKRGTETGLKVKVRTREGDATTHALMVDQAIEGIEKLGKKKNWVREWGLRMDLVRKENLWTRGTGGVYTWSDQNSD